MLLLEVDEKNFKFSPIYYMVADSGDTKNSSFSSTRKLDSKLQQVYFKKECMEGDKSYFNILKLEASKFAQVALEVRSSS